MFTVGPRIMSRPIARTSCPSACPTAWAVAGSQVAATPIPDGNAVLANFGNLESAALVSAEGPNHDRIPAGPSAILIDGIPSRGIATVSIQFAPLSSETFSSTVIRPSRSSTRFSTGCFVALYRACAGSSCAGVLGRANATAPTPNNTARASPTATMLLDPPLLPRFLRLFLSSMCPSSPELHNFHVGILCRQWPCKNRKKILLLILHQRPIGHQPHINHFLP